MIIVTHTTPHNSVRIRRGVSLLELLCVLVLIGVLTAVAVPRWAAFRNWLAVHAAANRGDALFAKARHVAMAQSIRTSVIVGSPASLALVVGSDTLQQYALDTLYGVSLSASRISSTFAPSGVAMGGANLTLVFSRGAATESLFVSRLGRVRRQ